VLTEIRQESFASIYAELEHEFPDRPWCKQITRLGYGMKETPVSTEWLQTSYVLSYGLNEYHLHGLQPSSAAWPSVLEAMKLVGQALHLLESGAVGGPESLKARLLAAFKEPDEYRSLSFELFVANHFHIRGVDIEWPDEHSGIETFDLLVHDPVIGAVEVECKTFSVDKGDALPIASIDAFANKLIRFLEPELCLEPDQLVCVSVVFNQKIPKKPKELDALIGSISECLFERKNLDDGLPIDISGICEISIRGALMEGFPFDQRGCHWQEAMDMLLGSQVPKCQPRTYAKHLLNGGGLGLRVDTTIPSKLDDRIMNESKRAIRSQMTGTRPGVLILKVERESDLTLEASARDSENRYRTLAEKLMKSSKNSHLSGVVFVSAPRWARVSQTVHKPRSSAYYFDNENCHYTPISLARFFNP